MTDDFTHEYAHVGGVRLHYVTAGEGPTVVLLHGWPQTWFMWRDVIPGLAAHHRVVAVDMRGLGDSSRPDSGYDTTTVSTDIWRLMHDRLGETGFFVAAHDWGGPVAFALAAQHRAEIRGMAIFDVPVPGDGEPTNFTRWHFGLHNEPDFPEALVAGREDLYLTHFFRKGGARPDAITPEAQAEYIRAYRQPGAMRAGFNYYRALRQDIGDHEAYLADRGPLEMPIMVYGGGDRWSGRGMAAMESWQRVATNVSGGVIDGCGHWLVEEQPDVVVERLLEFYRNLGS